MPRLRKGEPQPELQSVDRALALLELFSPARPRLGVAQVAGELGIGKSTAHRLLSTLAARGYLLYDRDTRLYRLGLAVVRLAHAALAAFDLREVARPHLRWLALETGESAFLLVEREGSAVVLESVESEQPLKLTLPAGLPWPLHAGASNKVLLAYLPEDRIERYLAGPLPRVTERTQVDPDRLRTELAAIRRRGYAYSDSELTPGVAAFAVPVIAGGQLLGAVAVAGPTVRFTAARRPEILAAVQRAAAAVGREAGARESDGGAQSARRHTAAD